MEEAELPSSSSLLGASGAAAMLAGAPFSPARCLHSAGHCPPLPFCSIAATAEAPRLITGRRQRCSLAEWGGSLDEVLREARQRAELRSIATAPATEGGDGSCSAPSRRRAEPDLSAWGGGLGDVLVQRHGVGRGPPSQRYGVGLDHQEHSEMESREEQQGARGSGRRPRATLNDWGGGGLADVLTRARTPPPRPPRASAPSQPSRSRAGSRGSAVTSPSLEESPALRPPLPGLGSRSGSRSALPRPSPSTPESWGGSLAEVLPPSTSRGRSEQQQQQHPESARRASSAVAVAIRTPSAARPRRARSIVVRPRDRHADCCPICLDSFEVRQRLAELPCGHRFHAVCVRDYFAIKENPTCPYCRADCSNLIV